MSRYYDGVEFGFTTRYAVRDSLNYYGHGVHVQHGFVHLYESSSDALSHALSASSSCG